MTKGAFDSFLSPDSFQWGSLSDITAEDNQHTWQSSAELTVDNPSQLHPSSSYSLADLLALFRARGDGQQPSLSDFASLKKPQLSTVSGEQATADWPVASKKKRNFSLGVAGKCCNQGCTKNDIGRLCWGKGEKDLWHEDVVMGSNEQCIKK